MLQRCCWLMLILALSTGPQVMAQAIQAEARLDTLERRIGEPLTYTLTVRHAPSLRVSWPAWADSLGGLEIVSTSAIDTAMEAGNVTQRQQLTLMAFDSGRYVIPPTEVPYLSPGQGDVRRVATRSLSVSVFTVPVDTTANIRSIKDIQRDPLSLEEILLNLGLVLAVLAVIAAIVWGIVRYRRKKPVLPVRVRPQVPPHEVAMRELSQLESQRMWQKGNLKEYHAGISTILRRYIEARYRVPALESVTDEILRDLRPLGVQPRQLERLTHLLQMADLAKFAKSQPSETDNLQAMEAARDFVRSTKAEKAEKAERTERAERTEKAEKAERTERAEGTERAEDAEMAEDTEEA